MKQIFAPWRMQYVKESGGDCDCFLCPVQHCNPDESNLVIFKGVESFVILNRYPYVSGHVMIAPYRHVAVPEELNSAEMMEMGLLVQRCLRALRVAYCPAGFNVGMNVGQAAGAGLKDHVHIHVVPRWNGDTNFISVMSDVKVIPEALEVTRGRLIQAFKDQEE